MNGIEMDGAALLALPFILTAFLVVGFCWLVLMGVRVLWRIGVALW